MSVWFKRGLESNVAERGTADTEDDHVFAAVAGSVLGEIGVRFFFYLVNGGEVFGAERVEWEIAPAGFIVSAHLGEAVGEVSHFGCSAGEGVGG